MDLPHVVSRKGLHTVKNKRFEQNILLEKNSTNSNSESTKIVASDGMKSLDICLEDTYLLEIKVC